MICYSPLKVYREAAARSSSPGQLVLMLLDGALRFMDSAVQGFEESNFIRRNELVHNNVLKSQAILSELQASLNLDAGGEFGSTMFRLYDFMLEQLRQANLKKVVEPIRVVMQLLGEIREAWSQMLLQQPTPRPAEGLAAAC
jgi:flagellar protein FliS